MLCRRCFGARTYWCRRRRWRRNGSRAGSGGSGGLVRPLSAPELLLGPVRFNLFFDLLCTKSHLLLKLARHILHFVFLFVFLFFIFLFSFLFGYVAVNFIIVLVVFITFLRALWMRYAESRLSVHLM
jgi:hypothetical protein